jgi:hypothetical protein
VPEHVCVCVQAWKLWNEDRAAEFMDESLAGSYSRDEAWRCYHVGLLCVQENPRAPADHVQRGAHAHQRRPDADAGARRCSRG